MHFSFISVICLFVFTLQSTVYSQSYTENNRSNVSAVLDNLIRGYDSRIRPKHGGEPVEVQVTMYILGLSANTEKMEITWEMYFRQSWKDARLEYHPDHGIDNLLLDGSSNVKIWEPDTFFANEKCSHLHETTKPNTFLKISSNGEVLKSSRLTVIASCPMNLQYFPMDSQQCTLEMESYAFSAKDVFYNWKTAKNSVGMSFDTSMPDFKVIGHRNKKAMVTLNTGNYSRLVVDVLLQRSSGYYVMQIYIPAFLIVAISLTAYLFKNSLIRALIGVFSSMSLIGLMSVTNTSLPKISYMKSIDVYLIVCFLTVLVTLIEHAFVECLATALQRNRSPSNDNNMLIGNDDKNTLGINMNTDSEGQSKVIKRLATMSQLSPNRIDLITIIGVPTFFVIFNIIYCIIYSCLSNGIADDIVLLGN